jgi:PAS domain S-box-containing protein
MQTKRELEQFANELAILQEIAIDLSSGLELPEVLNKIINYAARLTDADSGVVFLYEKDKLTEFHRFNLPPDYPLIHNLKDSYLYQRVLASKKSQIVKDYQRDIRANERLKRLGLKSMMVVPILSGARFLGFLELLQFASTKKFSEQDSRVLEILTRHAAIAMENAKYLGKIKEEASFRKAVSDFSADINSSLELSEVLEKLCQRTVEILELGGAYIWSLDEQKKDLHAAAADGYRADEFLKLSIPLSSSYAGAKVARSKQTMIVNDFESSGVKTFLAPFKPKSAMFVPLIFEDEIFGSMVLVDLKNPEKFDSSLAAKIETLAGQAVTAIRNAQLYEAEAKSRSFISGIFRDLPAAVAVLSVPHGRIVEANKNIERITGLKKVVGRSASNVFKGLPGLEIRNWLDQVAESRKPFSALDIQVDTRLGRTRWDFVLTPNLNPLNGEVETVTLMARETTEEFRLRNALEEAMTAEHNRREELEAVISGMSAGVSIYDVKGEPVYFNEFVKRMLEDGSISTRSTFEQRTLYHMRDAATGEELSPEDIPFARALRGKFSHMEVRVRTLKGHEKVLSVSGAPLKDKSGATLGVVLVSDDITPLRQAQEKLESSLRTTEILLESSKALTSSLSLNSVLDKLTSLISKVTGCSRVGIVLYEPEADEFVVAGTRGSYAQVGQRLKVSEMGEGFRLPYQSGETVVLDKSDPSLGQETKDSMGTRDAVSVLLVPVKSKRKILGHINVDEPGKQQVFSAEEIELLESIAYQTAIAIENASLYESEARRSKQLQTLQRLGLRISKERDPSKIARVLCESARKLLNTQVASVAFLVDEKWQWPHFSRAKDCPYDCEMAKSQAEFSVYGRPYSEMMETRKPIMMMDVSQHPSSKGVPKDHIPLRGLLGAPLLDSRGEFMGQVMVSDKRDGSYFNADDANLLVTLAGQASVTLEKAKAYEREHKVATVLQESLLTEPSAHPELEVSLLYRAASDVGKVGGDFYDFIEVEDDITAVVVGDIAGKGIQAATLTAMAKNFIRAYACEDCKPAAVLARANRALYSQVRSPDFISVIYGLLDRKKGTFAYSNAGHPWPMILENRGQKVRLAPGVNLPLGIQLGEKYREHVLKLRVGDRLVLYTDGVTETRKRGRIWGEDGLQKALLTYAKLSCNELSSRVLKEILEFSGGRLSDDIIILILRWIPRKV